MMRRELGSKKELKELREEIKVKGFTEIKCSYKAGKYIVDYIEQEMSKNELALNGLIKTKGVKELNIIDQNKLRAAGKLV